MLAKSSSKQVTAYFSKAVTGKIENVLVAQEAASPITLPNAATVFNKWIMQQIFRKFMAKH
jgi:hypothetical protein